MENENGAEDILNPQEQEVLETSNEEAGEEEAEESIDELKARLQKAEELANNQKIRAEKAERLAKGVKAPEAEPKPAPTAGGLSQKDVIYVAKADIHEDDVDEVLRHATVNKVSVKEAHEYLKPILAIREEQRKVASAANVGGSRRGSGKVSDDILLSKAEKGEIPDNDADLERLLRARKPYKN